MGTDKEQRAEYYVLVRMIKEHGRIGATKKHGCYMVFDLPFVQQLRLDTWSKAIVLYRGKGRQVTPLGIDFGGFEVHEPERVRTLVAVLKALLPSHVTENEDARLP